MTLVLSQCFFAQLELSWTHTNVIRYLLIPAGRMASTQQSLGCWGVEDLGVVPSDSPDGLPHGEPPQHKIAARAARSPPANCARFSRGPGASCHILSIAENGLSVVHSSLGLWIELNCEAVETCRCCQLSRPEPHRHGWIIGKLATLP